MLLPLFGRSHYPDFPIPWTDLLWALIPVAAYVVFIVVTLRRYRPMNIGGCLVVYESGYLPWKIYRHGLPMGSARTKAIALQIARKWNRG